MNIPPTGDWSTSYSQYLARSVSVSTRTLSFYQATLERIAQGQLLPSAFQDYFPSFVTACGGEYSQNLSDAVSGFLQDLVSLGAEFGKRQDAAPEEAEITPPHFDAANPTRWYEELAEYAGRLNARALKAYRTQLDRVAAGEVTPSEVQQGTNAAMTQNLPAFLQSFTQAYFKLLNRLNDVRAEYEERYFQGLLGRADSPPNDPPVTLTMGGPLGTTATVSLAVTNTTAGPSHILAQVSDVRRVDGVGPGIFPVIGCAPEGLELGPNEEGTLKLSLDLNPAQFDPGVVYAGRLHLIGGAEVPLPMELRILASDAGAENEATS